MLAIPNNYLMGQGEIRNKEHVFLLLAKRRHNLILWYYTFLKNSTGNNIEALNGKYVKDAANLERLENLFFA